MTDPPADPPGALAAVKALLATLDECDDHKARLDAIRALRQVHLNGGSTPDYINGIAWVLDAHWEEL